MKDISVDQLDGEICKRCIDWWIMYNDNDEEGVVRFTQQITGLVQYFREINNLYVADQDKSLWVQLEILLSDCDVALDGEDWEALEKYSTIVTAILWQVVEWVDGTKKRAE